MYFQHFANRKCTVLLILPYYILGTHNICFSYWFTNWLVLDYFLRISKEYAVKYGFELNFLGETISQFTVFIAHYITALQKHAIVHWNSNCLYLAALLTKICHYFLFLEYMPIDIPFGKVQQYFTVIVISNITLRLDYLHVQYPSKHECLRHIMSLTLL